MIGIFIAVSAILVYLFYHENRINDSASIGEVRNSIRMEIAKQKKEVMKLKITNKNHKELVCQDFTTSCPCVIVREKLIRIPPRSIVEIEIAIDLTKEEGLEPCKLAVEIKARTDKMTDDVVAILYLDLV